MIKRFGIGLINKTMNLNLLWFLPASLLYSFFWIEAIKEVKGKQILKNIEGFGSCWIAANIVIIVFISTWIGLYKFIK